MDSVMNVYRELTKIENEEERNNAIDELFSDPSLRVPFRMFLGRTFKGSNGLFLYDDQSRTRARFYIDKNNNAKLQFFDENGKKVYQIPESK